VLIYYSAIFLSPLTCPFLFTTTQPNSSRWRWCDQTTGDFKFLFSWPCHRFARLSVMQHVCGVL